MKLRHFLISILLILICQTTFAETLIGKVVGVTDGDTITVLDDSHTQFKIRLAGIDAPEKKQPFGQVSKKMLSDLVFQKMVQVEWKKQDRYGRLVGKVIVEQRDVNLEQVKYGLAWFYRKYQHELSPADRIAYDEAEVMAQQNKQGLWVYPNPMPPWEFRKNK